MICRDCNITIHPVMSFSKDKHEKLRDDELTFGEVLHKELKK